MPQLAIVCRGCHDYDAAIEFFNKDRLCNRLSPAYRHILSALLARIGKYEEAKLEIERARLEDPSLIYGYALVDPVSGWMTGTRYTGQHDTDEAWLRQVHVLARKRAVGRRHLSV